MIRFKIVFVSLLTVLLTVILARSVDAQEASPTPAPSPIAAPSPTATPRGWHIRLTPYLWAPTINGTFQFHHPSFPSGTEKITSAGVQLGPNSYLSKLNSAVELTVEADDAHSVVFGDVIYINASNTGATVFDLHGPTDHITFPINVSTSGRITTTLATIGIGPRLLGSETNAQLTGFVGLRYVDVSANVGWTLTGPLGHFSRTGSASESENDLAGIIGARGRVALGSSWYVPLYADYGGSGDLTTYQWAAGIAHSYHSGAQILVWRQLGYIGNTSNTTLVQTLHLGGPAFAWTFYL